MKTLLSFSRILVGNLFIFSGLVKANDPLGFSYKLEEYFVEFGMDWAWLHDILVPLAAAICIAEIVLGLAVLVGYKMKQVSWLLLTMIIFFTILTFASAVFEIVRSCGCFGDAIPLTPWDSFVKDLILLVFILILFSQRKHIVPALEIKIDMAYFFVSVLIMLGLSVMLDWYIPLYLTAGFLAIGLLVKQISHPLAAVSVVVVGLIGSTAFSVAAIESLPFKDFRPYAVGKNLPEQMVPPPNAKPSVYDTELVYKNIKTGEEKAFTMAEYNASKIWENKEWEWVSTDSKLIEEGDLAKITDFSILTHEDEDITDMVLDESDVLLVIAYDLAKTDTDHLNDINELAKQAEQAGIKVYGLSSAGYQQKEEFIKTNHLAFDFWITDGIVLKTMVRSNPGLIRLKKGTVTGKYHSNYLPQFKEIR